MGKTQNIKRAKKLKEAKRKADKATQSPPPGPALLKLLEKTGPINPDLATTLSTYKLKYSEILLEFAQPLINGVNNLEQFKAVLMVAITAWNLAHIKSTDNKKYKEVINDPKFLNAKNAPEIVLLNEMINRKMEEFNAYRFFISEFEVVLKSKRNYDVAVAVTL